MSTTDQPPLAAEIFEERSTLSIADLCRIFAVDERHIIELVEEGVLSVTHIDQTEWRFSGATLRRVRIALRLEHDLGVNPPGVALALDLLEELEQLRRLRQG